jgi:hypothetical protein
MSTVYNRTGRVTTVRKRPKKTSTNTKTAQVLFGDQPTKELKISEVYRKYNHKILEVNIADQLASSNSSQRRIRKGAWQAIDQWLFVSILVNSYLVAFYSKVKGKRQIKFRNQHDFRIQIIEGPLEIGKGALGLRKRRFSHSNCDDSNTQITDHHHEKRPSKSDCAAYKEGTYWERPIKRSPLAPISANQKRDFKRSNTIYSCKECNVTLCNKGPCFDRCHGIS